MNTSTRIVVSAIVVVVLVILAAFALQERAGTMVSSSTATSTSSLVATSTAPARTNITLTIGSTTIADGYTITAMPVGDAATVKQPNYKAPLEFASTIPTDEHAALQTQFNSVEAAIATNPNDLNSWIALGDVRKEAGDYAGAAADLQYVSDVAPTNIITFANLGDLYTNFLPNYPLAVQNLKQEIQNNPQDAYIYDDLYQLYTNKYPQPKAAIVAMLQAGLKANPGDSTLETDLSAEETK